MFRLFVKYVIGGRTGKREQAWAFTLLWFAAFAWTAAKEAGAVPMDGTREVLKLLVYPMTINLAAAYGMEWVSLQSKWRGGE